MICQLFVLKFPTFQMPNLKKKIFKFFIFFKFFFSNKLFFLQNFLRRLITRATLLPAKTPIYHKLFFSSIFYFSVFFYFFNFFIFIYF